MKLLKLEGGKNLGTGVSQAFTLKTKERYYTNLFYV